ncbi:MAG: GNAT family N-acetyltransferase, partial [FCB group bacterium]|nr:GNAT family N-acetyltransferase [FCB group bacterium]
DMEVAESHRRKGIGRALIGRLKEEVRDRDVMKMWVITERSNTAAVHLYESTGAVPQEVEDAVVFEYGEF